MTIDTHGHLVPPDRLAAIRQESGRLPSLRRGRAAVRAAPGTSDPAEALELIYTDTILHDPRVLRFVVEVMGADRIMLGSDMPFPIGDHEPRHIVEAAGLHPDQVEVINGGTATKLFRIG